MGEAAKVTNTCLVPLSIGENYIDQIACVVVNMDATNLILGKPWQFDRDVVHRERLNQYIIQVGNRGISSMPLPLRRPTS